MVNIVESVCCAPETNEALCLLCSNKKEEERGKEWEGINPKGQEI